MTVVPRSRLLLDFGLPLFISFECFIVFIFPQWQWKSKCWDSRWDTSSSVCCYCQPIVQNTRESGTTYQALEGTKRGQPVAQTSSPVYQSLAPNSASKPAEQEGNYQPLAKNRDSYRRPGQERLLCKAPLIFSPPHPQFFLQFFPVGCTLIVWPGLSMEILQITMKIEICPALYCVSRLRIESPLYRCIQLN